MAVEFKKQVQLTISAGDFETLQVIVEIARNAMVNARQGVPTEVSYLCFGTRINRGDAVEKLSVAILEA